MSASQLGFVGEHVVLPVIHVEDSDQARRNTALAREGAADGAFLINHAITSAQLLAIFAAVRDEHPGFWLGVNLLDLPVLDAMRAAADAGADGLWSDNAGLLESALEQPDVRAVRDCPDRPAN